MRNYTKTFIIIGNRQGLVYYSFHWLPAKGLTGLTSNRVTWLGICNLVLICVLYPNSSVYHHKLYFLGTRFSERTGNRGQFLEGKHHKLDLSTCVSLLGKVPSFFPARFTIRWLAFCYHFKEIHS